MSGRERYVCKAVAGKGWRIWNRKMNKWWGNHFKQFPAELLAELNGPKRPAEIARLSKGAGK
jgi:hypothetical protein